MFPIETNAEKPSPRSAAFSSSARPSAPLCDEKAMRPGGIARGAKVAFRPSAGHGDAEAVRADQPRAVRADEREQPRLPLDALLADLGEPAEMTQSAGTPLRSAASADSSTRAPGTQMTARSTASGISSIAR